MMMPDEDEEADIFQYTEPELEAATQREISKFNAWYDTLTHAQRYRYHRQFGLKNCKGWRRNIQLIGDHVTILRENLKRCQRRLVEIREFNKNGGWPEQKDEPNGS